MDKDTQLRHLPPASVFQLSQLLDVCGWKEVMAIVPSDPMDPLSKPKYKVEHIKLVENYADMQKRSYTDVLFQEWGTSGKVRPTLKTLLDVLVKAELFRAADYVAVDLLREPKPERPRQGPAAPVDVAIEDVPPVVPSILHDSAKNLIHIPYTLLEKITEQFNDISLEKSSLSDGSTSYIGHKLGSGAFGSVYFGIMPDGTRVAVKKLMNDTVSLFNQFQTEINILSTYQHPNLLPLLGYSCDTVEYCLVYEFMPNGSLLDCLAACRRECITLCWRTRMDIALGVCQGLHYLHTARSPPLIHRDVKTANILLDINMTARIGDFGLVRTSPSDSRITSTVFGTSAYMAPEAFRGDVSVKTDVFSLGVVLLELLTALPPYDSARDGADLVTFVEESVESSIEPLLDSTAKWSLDVAEAVFLIAQHCLEDKKKRPVVAIVIDSLRNVLENESIA